MSKLIDFILFCIALLFAGITAVLLLIYQVITMTFVFIVAGFFAFMAIFFKVEEHYINKDR